MRYPQADADTAAMLKALAHPARLAMVRALAAGGCGCGDIVRRLPLAQSTVSQHLKILKQAGLVDGVLEGPRASYCLVPARLAQAAAALAEMAAWAERPSCGIEAACDPSEWMPDGLARVEPCAAGQEAAACPGPRSSAPGDE